MTFALDPRLEEDYEFIYKLQLSEVRLSNNASFPWIILVPIRENIIELIDLSDVDQIQLLKEIRQASHVMRQLFHPQKLNIATLGNIVPQLHIHIVARFYADGAWPQPVWSSGVYSDYSPTEKRRIIDIIENEFDKR